MRRWFANHSKSLLRVSAAVLFVQALVLLLVARAVADDANAPHVVDITVLNESSEMKCKGVAITPTAVLTAAHCVADADTADIHIVFGANRSTGVSSSHLHPKFDRSKRIPLYDVAILKALTEVSDRGISIQRSSIDQGAPFVVYGMNDSNSVPYPFVVADTRKLIWDYIQLRRDVLPFKQLTAELENRLSSGDNRLAEKIQREFGHFIFTLYSTNHAGICKGDSGSPALVQRGGELRVVALATASADMEAGKNEICGGGGTSIFTHLQDESILTFIETVVPDARLS